MFSNIGPVQLLIVLAIVLAIFGTKRLRTLGSDLGSAVKGFRSAVNEAEETTEQLSDSSKEDADFDNTPVEENRKTPDTDANNVRHRFFGISNPLCDRADRARSETPA